MKEMVVSALVESARLKTESQNAADQIVTAATMVAGAFSSGGKLLLFGNGGSAADAQHLAAEFINRFTIERPPLPALALSTDTSVLTSISNDYSFNDIFIKQLKALGQPGDVAWGLTTSGNSPNVIGALGLARTMGLKTIVMTGRGGGEAKGLADVFIEIQSKKTPRVQEVHITMGHIICELVDYILFQRPGEVAGL